MLTVAARVAALAVVVTLWAMYFGGSDFWMTVAGGESGWVNVVMSRLPLGERVRALLILSDDVGPATPMTAKAAV